MSRCTQYIGLNDYAKNWLEENKHRIKKIEDYVMTEGLCYEPVIGRIWYLEPEDNEKAVNSEYIFTEVVQVEPWSSGPMIFTHLRVQLKKKVQTKLWDFGIWFSWIVDPSVKDSEFDSGTGRYWV